MPASANSKPSSPLSMRKSGMSPRGRQQVRGQLKDQLSKAEPHVLNGFRAKDLFGAASGLRRSGVPTYGAAFVTVISMRLFFPNQGTNRPNITTLQMFHGVDVVNDKDRPSHGPVLVRVHSPRPIGRPRSALLPQGARLPALAPTSGVGLSPHPAATAECEPVPESLHQQAVWHRPREWLREGLTWQSGRPRSSVPRSRSGSHRSKPWSSVLNHLER